MKNRSLTKRCLIASSLVCIAGVAEAFLRIPKSDQEVVSRAKLMVVGRVKPGSIVFVPHTPFKLPNGELHGTWEHHLELLIDEVLKGQMNATSMVVSIHAGLNPAIGGYYSNRNMNSFVVINVRGGRPNYPKEVIEIFDTGSSGEREGPVTGDLR